MIYFLIIINENFINCSTNIQYKVYKIGNLTYEPASILELLDRSSITECIASCRRSSDCYYIKYVAGLCELIDIIAYQSTNNHGIWNTEYYGMRKKLLLMNHDVSKTIHVSPPGVLSFVSLLSGLH